MATLYKIPCHTANFDVNNMKNTVVIGFYLLRTPYREQR